MNYVVKWGKPPIITHLKFSINPADRKYLQSQKLLELNFIELATILETSIRCNGYRKQKDRLKKPSQSESN